MEDLPPYGPLSIRYRQALDDDGLAIPPDWEPRDAGAAIPSEERRKAWDAWLTRMIEMLDGTLWPALSRDTAETRRERAERRMTLTDRDLRIMTQLADNMRVCAVFPTGIDEGRHDDLFAQEDRFGKPIEAGDMADTLRFYAPFLASSLGAQFVDAMATGRERKLGTLTLRLKAEFDRPRAYQTAALFGLAGSFHHQLAVTGCTPAFISGHCVQALMSSAYFDERLSATGVFVSDTISRSLQQHAADVGDRRVFAGVHYPSDSLGSWLVALCLTPYVFPAASVASAQAFVAGAVGRSAVYRALTQSQEGVYAAALQAVQKCMQQSIT
jgi:hypothetical protein